MMEGRQCKGRRLPQTRNPKRGRPVNYSLTICEKPFHSTKAPAKSSVDSTAMHVVMHRKTCKTPGGHNGNCIFSTPPQASEHCSKTVDKSRMVTMPHCSNKFTHTCVGHLSFALQGESPCHMSAAVSFGNIYLYPFASSLRDGKVEYTYRLKIPSETEPQHPTDFFTTLSVHSLVTNMPMIIFVFSSFGQLGRRSLVVQLVDTDHRQQDVAVRDHLPCSG